MGEDDLGLTAKVDKIYEHLGIGEDKVKKREKEWTFKIPLGILWKKKNIVKNNKLMVLYLRTNNKIEVVCKDIVNGMICFGDKFHAVQNLHVFDKDGIPTVILPEWSLEPVGTYALWGSENQTDPEAIIIRGIETKEAQLGKSKFSFGKNWIWILLIGAAILYVLFGGNSLFAGK